MTWDFSFMCKCVIMDAHNDTHEQIPGSHSLFALLPYNSRSGRPGIANERQAELFIL